MLRVVVGFIILAVISWNPAISSAAGSPEVSATTQMSGQGDSATFVELVQLAQANLLKAPSDDRDVAARIFRDAWAVAIQFAGESDPQAQKAIEKSWTEAWTHPENSALLSSALARGGGSAEFLTPEVLASWSTATDQSTLDSMCYWTARHGSDEDAARLEAKIKSISDPVNQQHIADALSWRLYWSNPSHGEPEGAQPHPGE